MASLSSLYRELSRYNTLLGNVYGMIKHVDNAISSLDNALETVTTKMDEYYAIDDSRADSEHILNCRKDLVVQNEYLNNKTVPAINNEIARIQREIEILESEDDD